MSLRSALGTLRARLASALIGVSRDSVARLEGADRALREELAAARNVSGALAERIERLELHARVAPTMAWIEHQEVPGDVLVSVILPTRDRPDLLRRAVGSVLGQSHGSLELLVVDDGTAASQSLSGIEDARLRVIRSGGRGACAARNAGLEAASGQIIAYLDDDNRMHPHWLRSVVWAFAAGPDARVLYGARVIEDGSPEGSPGELPRMHLEPFDRRRLERGNYVDMNVIAHRPDARPRFDEGLATHGDWDLILRLTEERPPMVLPAIAALYSTSAPGRLEGHPARDADRHAIETRLRERPLRVLAYNAMFPLLSEVYMEDELEALAVQGAHLAYARRYAPATPLPVRRTVYDDLGQAVRGFGPDVLFLYWLTFAEESLPLIQDLDLPFAVRVHSFDFDPELARRVRSHPNCIGMWAYPHQVPLLPDARALPTVFSSAPRLPAPRPERRRIMLTCAGLPKKDWDTVVSSLCALPGTDRLIVMGVTNEFEELPDQIRGRLEACEDPPELRTNVPRQEVFDLLAGTAVSLYTLDPGQSFGNPMSVIEALCAGTSVILPDRPEARAFAGPNARFYRTAGDIVRHAREVLAGGPGIEAEQAANRAYGRERFCDPAVPKRFFSELNEAVEAWNRR